MKLDKNHFSGGRNLSAHGLKGLSAVLNGKIDRSKLAAITPIATPSTATSQQNAEKINAILAALKSDT